MDADVIIVGAGTAGLIAARALCRGAVAPDRILILDTPSPAADGPAVSWWATADDPLDDLATHRWERFEVRGRRTARPALGPYAYKAVAGPTLQARLRDALATAGAVVEEASVDGIEASRDRVIVRAGARSWSARWALDGRFELADLPELPDRVRLLQRSVGVRVRAPRDVFDPDVPVLMDLTARPAEGFGFVHVLPWSSREALVEGVSMGRDVAVPDVRAWLAHLGDDLEITPCEGGTTPMTDTVFPRRVGARVLRIGTAGGQLKPSTGYGVSRMAADAEAIATSLQRRGHPFGVSRSGVLWRGLDAVMLRMMDRFPALAAVSMERLFTQQPASRVLRFLDERATWSEIASVGAVLPRAPFVLGLLEEGFRTVRRALYRFRAAFRRWIGKDPRG